MRLREGVRRNEIEATCNRTFVSKFGMLSNQDICIIVAFIAEILHWLLCTVAMSFWIK